MTSEGELDQLDVDGEPPEFDLAPRPPARAPGSGRGNRRWAALAVLVVLAIAAGFLVTKALGGATDYFYQVDEAVAQRPQLGTHRFRIQGTVTDQPQGVSINDQTQKITFGLAANRISAHVIYTGSDPPSLFKQCEPVVIVGHWRSAAADAPFIGDQIIIKHSESYTAKHADRLKSDPSCK